jgi:Methylene-tetrahydrofolate reductase C terminal
VVVVDSPARTDTSASAGPEAGSQAVLRAALPERPPSPAAPTTPARHRTGSSSGPDRALSATRSVLSLSPRPTRPKVSFRAMRGLHALLARNPVWSAVAARLESSPTLYRAFTSAEKAVKQRLFGCRMCAQCALPTTAYTCPMTCPKQLRNGPCGGVAPDGSCEVYPGTRCVWLIAYERAEQDGRVADLCRLQRPIDQRKWGESAWINYWQGRDEGLWTKEAAPEVSRFELPVLQ